jgi:hypothetical protein
MRWRDDKMIRGRDKRARLTSKPISNLRGKSMAKAAFGKEKVRRKLSSDLEESVTRRRFQRIRY